MENKSQWFIKGSIKVNKQIVKGYWKTNLNKLLDNWSSKRSLKFCKVSISETEYITFIFYNSENFTKENKDVYGSCIILDRFQILIQENTILSPTFNEEFKRYIKKCSKRKVSIYKWYEKDVVRKELEKIGELLSNLDAYKFTDRLLGYEEEGKFTLTI